MFEAFERRQVDRRTWIVPVVVVLAVMIGLVMYWRRTEDRRAVERVEQLFKLVDPPVEPFVRVELPGMSLEAPSAATPTGDYANGSVSQLVPEWAITWQSGKLPPTDVLQSIVGTMRRAVEQQRHSPMQLAGENDATLDRSRARQFELRSEGALSYSLRVTFGECGGRVVQILNGGISRVKDIHDHMVESFRCHPDPAQDAEGASVVVDARPGWHIALPGRKNMLANARHVVVQPRTLPAVAGALPPEQYMTTSARAAGFQLEGKPVSRHGRLVGTGAMVSDGSSTPMAMVVWTCADGRVAVVYVNAPRRADLEDGIDLALTGRCLAPGEPAPVYPPAEPRRKRK